MEKIILFLLILGAQAKSTFLELRVPEEQVSIPAAGNSLAELQTFKIGKNILCAKILSLNSNNPGTRYFCSLGLNKLGRVEDLGAQ